MFGFWSANSFEQSTIIQNFDLLADALSIKGLNFNKLNQAGVCSGLTLMFLYYAKENRLNEFYLYLSFLSQLNNKKAIQALVERYSQYRKAGIELWLTVKNSPEKVTFNRLLSFVKDVHLSQLDRKIDFIGAKWERNFSFVCRSTELGNFLRIARIADAELVEVSIGTHIFGIQKINDGYHLFEPENIIPILMKEDIPKYLIKNEDELAEAITTNLKKNGFLDSMLDCNNSDSYFEMMFSLHFLSSDRKSHRLDLLIDNLEKSAQIKNPKIQALIKEFRISELSRADFALTLYDILSADDQHKELECFVTKLREFILSEKLNLDQDILQRIILDNKSHLNQTAFRTKITLMFLAIRANQIQLVAQLLKNGFNANVEDPSCFNQPYLFVAAWLGHYSIVEMLINHGANIDCQDESGATPLAVAASNGYLEIARLLLSTKKANVNVTCTEMKFTPLMTAIEGKHVDMVRLLLANDANPNIKTTSETSAMHVAARVGSPEIIAELIKYGADSTTVNKFNHTPIYDAALAGHANIVEFLIVNESDRDLLNSTIHFNNAIQFLKTTNMDSPNSDYSHELEQAYKLNHTYFKERLNYFLADLRTYKLPRSHIKKLLFSQTVLNSADNELIEIVKKYADNNLELNDIEMQNLRDASDTRKNQNVKRRKF